MPSLAQVIGDAKSQITQNAKNSVNQTKAVLDQTEQAVIGSVKSQVVNRVNNTVNAAVNTGITGLTGAAAKLMTGQFSGAASELFGLPQDMLSSGIGALGISSGSTLSGGNSGFVASNNNGIQEGNALYGMLARADPVVSYNWYAQFPVIYSPIGAVGIPWYYIEEATLPFRSFEPTSLFRDGHTRSYAGKYSVDQLSVAFYADVNNVAINYLQAWNSSIVYPTTAGNYVKASGNFQRANQYKKSCFFYLLDPARQVIYIIQYVGVWPTSMDSFSLQSSSSDRVVLRMTFSVDDVFCFQSGLSSLSVESILNAANPIPTIVNGAINSVSRAAGGLINQGVSSLSQEIGSFTSSFF